MAPAARAEPALVAKALGAVTKPVADVTAPVLASSRFVLVGVVAHGARGAALIAVDGKLAKPYAVGATVGDDFVLKSVQSRQAVLRSAATSTTQGGSELTLAMPVITDKKGL
jgi:general secretion pathway protein C